MQHYLKAISFFILIIVLSSCNDQGSKKSLIDEPINDSVFTLNQDSLVTTLKDSIDDSYNYTEVIQEPKVFIDSTNHNKFLSKDGSYDINWNLLSDAVMDLTYFPEHQASGYYAEFGSSPLFLRDKVVAIEGYVVPFLVDTVKNEITYVLSQNPKSACFFCGAGGPESVMELILKPGHRKYREDEYLKFKVRLVLNNGNPMRLNYLLYDSEELW